MLARRNIGAAQRGRHCYDIDEARVGRVKSYLFLEIDSDAGHFVIPTSEACREGGGRCGIYNRPTWLHGKLPAFVAYEECRRVE